MMLAISFVSCKDDDQADELTCENGFELIDNSCQCPTDKIQIGENVCRALNEKEYWATMPSSYPCRDTFLIDFGGVDTIEEYILVDMIILNAEAFDGTIPVQQFSVRFEIRENTDGKEFYTKSVDIDPVCDINGVRTATKWEGKIVADTEVHVKMYHRNFINAYETIDSTELIFTNTIL